MHAIEVAELGGPEVLRYVDKPQPSPASGEVLIKAEAIGVNFIDTYFRSGQYPRQLPFVLGTEVSGTVAVVGDGVTRLRVGDQVVTAAAAGPTPNTARRQQNSSHLYRSGSTAMWRLRRC
ncbi:alcohol dehydrogenase GroES-like domain protein [Mycobacterium xenopi 4042]|uniref:Alcohol dehydrogenase GroES-like domain protein n=1 Tax=Mycobacterium xenopi 4042 TaxID=1299334 RepID=X7YPC8_MYCXE|nr:alcohol dehydrogenase GroES-like domain protein [Mycobacterium xenopi 4042]EUA34937.1 alcohol dehydrogenase GroES-like domain protein [Mycobacterium xenopi 3993]